MTVNLLVHAIMVGLVSLAVSPLAAQELENRFPADADSATSPTYTYSQPTYTPPSTYHSEPMAIIHQRAQERAAQRQLRLASMSWYGMSNSRPTASPTPFATLYSPVWQMPGGRPYAWHTTNWPAWPAFVR